MAAFKKIVYTLFISLSFITPSFAVALAPGAGYEFYTLGYDAGEIDILTRNGVPVESHLVQIDPATGDLRTIGYTGFVNCKALDFNLEGNLYAKCQRPLEPFAPVMVHIDPSTGHGTEIGETGVTENISDITITPELRLFAYEEPEGTHNFHEVDNATGAAGFIGNPGLEGLGNALFTTKPPYEIKLVTWKDDVNQVYTIDMDTAEPKLIANLDMIDLTDGVVAQQEGPCLAIGGDSLESFETGDVVVNALLEEGQATARAPSVSSAFDAAVLIELPGVGAAGDVQTKIIDEAHMALGFIDLKAGRAFITTNIAPSYVLDGLAVRKIEPRSIPTLSEWGLIGTSILLFTFGLYFMIRRNKLGSMV